MIASARRLQTIDGLDVAQRLALDVTDQASVETAIHQAGEIDVLVSNAGETLFATVEGTPPEEFDRMFQLNTLGALRVAKAVLSQMRERDSGRLIFVSSLAGRLSLPLGGAYAQSKWALEGIAETLALELSQTGVHVSLIEPGAIAGIGRSKAPIFTDELDTYAPFWKNLADMAGEDGMPTEAIASVIADVIEDPQPHFRRAGDEQIEHVLQALDASDRFAAPFDISALG